MAGDPLVRCGLRYHDTQLSTQVTLLPRKVVGTAPVVSSDSPAQPARVFHEEAAFTAQPSGPIRRRLGQALERQCPVNLQLRARKVTAEPVRFSSLSPFGQ